MLRALRHDHHRRGARAQPQHRLPARLPQAAAPPPARPQADHHLGDDRHRSGSPQHFGGAPVVEVSGRTYPVEVRYRPVVDPDDEDDDEDSATRSRRSSTRSTSCAREGPGRHAGVPVRRARDPRHRRRAARARAHARAPRSCRCTRGCPPPSSTGSSPPHTGRRVVLATNVAETSLTVPGIRYVVDPGTARISRYSHRLKVQRLPIEPVSQARPTSARAAAAASPTASASGSTPRRTSTRRPEFTEPEILRTNLASVILQMTALGLGDIAAFPFVDPPDRRQVKRRRRAARGARRARHDRARPGTAAHPARPPAGPAAGRPAAGPDGARGRPQRLRARGARHRRRAVDPGPARAAAGQAAGRRRDAPPVRRRPLRLPGLPATCGLPAGAAEGAVRQRVPPAVPRRVPALPAGPRVAGPASASCARSAQARSASAPSRRARRARRRPAAGPPVAAGRAAVPHRPAGPGQARVPRRARRAVRAVPRVGAVQEAAALGDGRRAGRDLPAVGPRPRPRIEPEWVEPLAGHLVKRTYSEPHWRAKQRRGDGRTRR